MARIKIALHPVVGRAMTETLERFSVGSFMTVELCPTEEHFANSVDQGRVRIALALNIGMMFPVNGDPFLGDHASGQPKPETEEVHDCWMQVKTPMRLAAVQEHSH